uniref:Uncharacterized protein n=1 Tax=Candidatus Kentrum sp. MB TaxID=2138164 RepID=A0A451BGT1_9GAMM|nr:MAG: hypothetical protein BECKMB1821I_GA0114274_11527 [Candidatus Kentron sp. MB]VFK77467.1 MAG: hypothetical protein BECKMB1821H_GA0114242_11437 [Candidatus Kentron sp. MB]
MHKDEIIAEIRRNRDACAARRHHNLAEIVADIKIRQKRPGCKLVDRRKPALSTRPNNRPCRVGQGEQAPVRGG